MTLTQHVAAWDPILEKRSFRRPDPGYAVWTHGPSMFWLPLIVAQPVPGSSDSVMLDCMEFTTYYSTPFGPRVRRHIFMRAAVEDMKIDFISILHHGISFSYSQYPPDFLKLASVKSDTNKVSCAS